MRPMRLARRKAVLLLALLAIAGCATPLSKGKSPLLPPQMSPDSVVLEMFFVRVPFGDPAVNGKLWDEIDEQPLAAGLAGAARAERFPRRAAGRTSAR